MNRNRARVARAICALIAACLSMKIVAGETTTMQIVTAANKFLSTLEANQRQAVVFAFDDEKQRARWSNFPIAMVPRGGLSLKELNPAQRSAAMALMSTVLSQRGFEKVQEIMEGDEVNKTTDTGRRPLGNGGPRPGNGGPPPDNRGPGPDNAGSQPPFAARWTSSAVWQPTNVWERSLLYFLPGNSF